MRNNILKRILVTVLTGTLAFGALTGCGAAGNANNNSGDANASAEQKADNTEKIKVVAATGANPRPFIYYDENNQLTGHNYELVEAIFEKLPQYELVWEPTDFPSIFAGLDSDKYQLGVNNFAKNPEREEKYIFTDAIFANEYIVVAAKNIELPETVSAKDLAGLNYIGQSGINVTTYAEKYNEENPDNQILLNYTEEDLNIQLSDIESGKYDFLIIDKPMYFGFYQPEFGYDLNTYSLEGFGQGQGLDSYLIVSQGNDQLAKDINEALAEVIAEGKSTDINLKYFGDDYTPKN